MRSITLNRPTQTGIISLLGADFIKDYSRAHFVLAALLLDKADSQQDCVIMAC